MALSLAGSAAARVALGQWRWVDLIAPGVLIALQPFTEWTTHVLLLHQRPRKVLGVTIDPLVARKHRAHHADPKDPQLVFVPLPAVVATVVGAAALMLVIARPPVALGGMVTAYSLLLLYEWTHFLIHSTYRPRHRLYRYVWRAHRNHHYRNEHYWFGVTIHVADHLFGTFPEKTAVPVSPTARTLGVEAA